MRYEGELTAVLQEIMARWDVPGLAVGTVEGEEIVYAQGFGVQSLETRAPVTPDSVFCLQSVSKCLVATAVMQWAERGKLDLDAPLVQYLPYFRMDDERCGQITIRQMLSHTSGMPDIEESEYSEWVMHPETDEGAAERFVRSLGDQALVADPGTRFDYSNIAYDVLGDLLAKLSGQPFESAMREQILIPAGMPNSTFLPSDIPADALAWPHLWSPEMKVIPSYPYHRADAPASFLHSTVLDMCQWGSVSLARGSHAGQRILSRAGYEMMWAPVAKRGDPPSMYEEMGLGWTLGHFKDRKTVCHGGAGFGGTSFFFIVPEANRGAVVLCNQESSAHMQAVQAVAHVLVDERPQADAFAVSWVVPISRALAEGGIDAARARCSEIRAGEAQEYFASAYDLDNLAMQLTMAGRPELALSVLGLNIEAFPAHIDSYLGQAQLCLQRGKTAQAREILAKALSIDPTDATAASLLQRAQQT